MPEEVAAVLHARAGGRYVDATVGEGGHAERILEDSAPDGELLGLDWDAEALEMSRARLARFGSRVRLVQRGFGEVGSALRDVGWGEGADGILVDLGVSTLQLGRAERGFSFAADGPLDMRMDRSRARTAADLVREMSERELADVLRTFGEEPAARRIARSIVRRRDQGPIRTTSELRQAVVEAGVRPRKGRDPATRTFQALRIAVNDELGELERMLDEGWQLLRGAGRMVILSYHSLEDRLVKQAFRRWAAKCVCPPGHPVCDCGWSPKATLLMRRRLRPSAAEVEANPRARSAGLRAVEVLGGDPAPRTRGRRRKGMHSGGFGPLPGGH
jgi:16S rRNA (cytosine1402-N4)-methyltransferase